MAMWSNLQFTNFKDRLFIFIEESMREYRIYEGIDIAALYLEKHPVLCLAVMASGVACFIPVVIFMMFAVISFLITFTGFVVIEGTIIGIGLAALIGFLLSLLLLLLTMTAIISTVYFTFIQLFGSTKKRLQPHYSTVHNNAHANNSSN